MAADRKRRAVNRSYTTGEASSLGPRTIAHVSNCSWVFGPRAADFSSRGYRRRCAQVAFAFVRPLRLLSLFSAPMVASFLSLLLTSSPSTAISQNMSHVVWTILRWLMWLLTVRPKPTRVTKSVALHGVKPIFTSVAQQYWPRPFVAGCRFCNKSSPVGLGERLRLMGRLACSQQWLDQLISPIAFPHGYRA